LFSVTLSQIANHFFFDGSSDVGVKGAMDIFAPDEFVPTVGREVEVTAAADAAPV
jgi:hypothetical protein